MMSVEDSARRDIMNFLLTVDEGYYWWYRKQAIIDAVSCAKRSLWKYLATLKREGLIEFKTFLEDKTYKHILLYGATDKAIMLKRNGKLYKYLLS